MRCPSCNKFVALEFQDPELIDIDVDADGVRAEVRIVRCCAECGDELKEATLNLYYEWWKEFDEEHGDHDLTVEETGIEPLEEDGGRYAKSYFGANVQFTVTCSCGQCFSAEMEEKIAASYMEELV